MAMYEPFGATDWSRLAIVLHHFSRIIDSGALDENDDDLIRINPHEFSACGGIPSTSNPDQLYSLKRQVKIAKRKVTGIMLRGEKYTTPSEVKKEK